MKPDGTALYYCDTFYDRCYQVTLSTPWDITSALPTFATSPAFSGDSFPADVFIKPDGTQLFVLGSGNDMLYEFGLATAWDITSIGASTSFSIAFEPNGRSLFFRPDGRAVYVGGNVTAAIHQRVLTTPWDITTMSLTDEATLALTPTLGVADFHLGADLLRRQNPDRFREVAFGGGVRIDRERVAFAT